MSASVATATITIRTSEDTKKKAQELFNDLGMDMSTAVNTFLRQAIDENGLPFCPRRHIPNTETLQAIEDMEKNEGVEGPFYSVGELMEALDA